MYTQDIKENVGIKDSYTKGKNETDKEEEAIARKEIDEYEAEHPDKEEVPEDSAEKQAPNDYSTI